MNTGIEDIPIDEHFESEYRMFIPLTIDDMEIDDTSYFFSGTKLLLLAMGLMPYFGIFFMLNAIPSVGVFIILTVIYMIIYSFYARFIVFEESKQRKQMQELENNKYSDMSYFWEWDKVGVGNRDNGLAYIQSDGISLRRAYLIKVDSGSDVGVPEGHYRSYRQTLQDFYRMFYKLGMDVKVYNIRKRPGLSSALRDYSTMLMKLDRDKQSALIKLSQLNIDINFLYSRVKEQRYVTYYLVVNKKIENITNFRSIVQDVVDKTLATNIAFYEPHIMSKAEVDEFLAEYYDVDGVNSAGIHKMNGFRDLNDYVELVAIYDREGKLIPVSIFDELSQSDQRIAGDRKIEDLIAEQEKEDAKWEERRKRSYSSKESSLMQERREDKITYEEYQQRLAKLKFDHLPENFNGDIEIGEDARKKRDQERQEAEWKEIRKARIRQQQSERDKKWYEQEDVDKALEPEMRLDSRPRVKKVVHDDGQIEWDKTADLDDDITLEDLMNR